ncbi:MAG: hypothetical protein FJ197_08580 [Gammaproteobacteria bacterium]|nr:hypothetical protein [Gammaproteobacteria bacterium]
MTALARWLGEHRAARIAATVALFPLPFIAIASAAIVAFTTIGKGWREAGQDILFGGAALAALAVIAGIGWLQLLGVAALSWSVAMLAAHLYRRWSLDLALQVLVLVGVAGAMALQLVQPDSAVYWRDVLGSIRETAITSGIEMPAEVVAQAAEVMTGVMGAFFLGAAVMALCLGAWLAGGGFSARFRELRMGRIIGALAAGLLVLASVGNADFADDLLIVILVGFILQGLAVLHWQAVRRAWPPYWAVAVYLPLVLVPAVGVLECGLLAIVGLLDNAVSLRRPEPGMV